MSKSVPKISEAEWDVMTVVWEHEPVTAQAVHERLDSKDWTLRTVKSFLARLVKKGALVYEAEGRRYLYRAKFSREQCVRAASESFLARVLDGSASPMLAYFVKEGKLSEDEIQGLRDLLDEQEGKR